MSRWSILTAAMFAMVSSASFGANVPFTGANCDLKDPPRNSGEENVHGYALKIYPRMKDIPANYDGCLLLWAPTPEGYGVLGATKFDQGKAVAHWSGVDHTVCKYQAGEPVGGTSHCPMYRFITPKSMPAGCVERKMQAGGAVPGCEYE